MKITIDCRILTSPRRSGVVVYTERLVEGLSRLGGGHSYELLLLGLSRAARKVRPAPGGAAAAHVLPVPDRDFPGKQALLNRALLPAWLALRGADLFHLPADYRFPARLPLGRRVRRVITIHDLRGLYEIPGDLPQDIEGLQRCSRQADMIITVSEFTRQDLEQRFGVPPERIRVTYLGVEPENRVIDDPAPLEHLRGRLGLSGPYFLSLGLVPRKNIERLLLAFDGLSCRDDFTLVLAGHLTDSWWCRRYRELIAERGLQRRVLITGALSAEDLVLLYNGARAFVFPSLVEGFGLPLLEAMACGAPVLTSDCTAMPEVAGGAALLVDPHEVESIREGMERLAVDEALRRRQRELGLRRAAEFSWERMARQVLAAYEATG